MATITYANVVFAIANNFPAGGSSGKPEVVREMSTRNRKYVEATVQLGDGVTNNQYPTGGVPITGGTLALGMGGGVEPVQACVGLGCPHALETLNILGDPLPADIGYFPVWDKPNNKIKLVVGSAGGAYAPSAPGAEVPNGTAIPAITLRVNGFGW